jgi:hypothetical protein
MASTDQSDNVQSFIAITSATQTQAEFFLASASNDLELAISTFFESAPDSTTDAVPEQMDYEQDDQEGVDQNDDDDNDERMNELEQNPEFNRLLATNDADGMRKFIEQASLGITPSAASTAANAPAAVTTAQGGRSWGAGNTLSGAASTDPTASSSSTWHRWVTRYPLHRTSD